MTTTLKAEVAVCPPGAANDTVTGYVPGGDVTLPSRRNPAVPGRTPSADVPVATRATPASPERAAVIWSPSWSVEDAFSVTGAVAPKASLYWIVGFPGVVEVSGPTIVKSASLTSKK